MKPAPWYCRLPGIRHLRYLAFANAIERRADACRMLGVNYRYLENDLLRADLIWRGKL